MTNRRTLREKPSCHVCEVMMEQKQHKLLNFAPVSSDAWLESATSSTTTMTMTAMLLPLKLVQVIAFSLYSCLILLSLFARALSHFARALSLFSECNLTPSHVHSLLSYLSLTLTLTFVLSLTLILSHSHFRSHPATTDLT